MENFSRLEDGRETQLTTPQAGGFLPDHSIAVPVSAALKMLLSAKCLLHSAESVSKHWLQSNRWVNGRSGSQTGLFSSRGLPHVVSKQN